jgi:hypothetical protein
MDFKRTDEFILLKMSRRSDHCMGSREDSIKSDDIGLSWLIEASYYREEVTWNRRMRQPDNESLTGTNQIRAGIGEDKTQITEM